MNPEIAQDRAGEVSPRRRRTKGGKKGERPSQNRGECEYAIKNLDFWYSGGGGPSPFLGGICSGMEELLVWTQILVENKKRIRSDASASRET